MCYNIKENVFRSSLPQGILVVAENEPQGIMFGRFTKSVDEGDLYS